MVFMTVPDGYEKTSLSDLQGAWGNLRDTVVENGNFINANKILFHIDEAMSWESVRNLDQMKATLLLIHNLAAQAKAPAEIIELIADVRYDLEEVFSEISEGKII